MLLQSLTALLQITDRRVKGPSPTFERAHLLLAFLTIGESKTIGRAALAVRSGLGEGAVRTVLKKLRQYGYADADASGCHLTAAGKRVYETTTRKLSPTASLQASPLTVGGYQVALAVRGAGRAVRNGIEERDSAIKVGAAGATTYVIKEDRFAIPGGSSDCERDFPSKGWPVLRNELNPRNGDAVILCGAKDETTARLGALSAAATLL